MLSYLHTTIMILLHLIYLIPNINPIQVSPTWIPSNYIKSDNILITNGTQITSSAPLTITTTFSSAFTSIPKFCYGIFGM